MDATKNNPPFASTDNIVVAWLLSGDEFINLSIDHKI
jgi:hypothetical protein